MPIHFKRLTPAGTAAIAIIQLWGDPDEEGKDVKALLSEFAGKDPEFNWPDHRYLFTHYADIDEGLTVFLPPNMAQLMPHGGMFGVTQICEKLKTFGAKPVTEQSEFQPNNRELYPEAQNNMEADMLAALARAQSGSAIDLLLKQPILWREWWAGKKDLFHHPDPPEAEKEALSVELDNLKSRAAILNQLIDPPLIILAGEPNSGKSTLTNELVGRTAAIVSETPGTTRDYVSTLVELNMGEYTLTANWYDTPGLRETEDAIEAKAIEIATSILPQADLILQIKPPSQDGHDFQFPALPQTSVKSIKSIKAIKSIKSIKAISQSDLSVDQQESHLHFSVHAQQGMEALQTAIFEALGLTQAVLADDAPWAFSPHLMDWVDSLLNASE